MKKKRIIIIVFLVLISLLSILTVALDFTTTNNKLNYKGITVDMLTDNNTKYNVDGWYYNTSTKIFYPTNRIITPLPQIVFNISKPRTETVCTQVNQYYTQCSYEKIDFSKFVSKNSITKQLVKEKKISSIDSKLELIGDIIEETKYYLYEFYGVISDLDPEFLQVFTSSSSGFFNQTEGTALGVSLLFNDTDYFVTNSYNYTQGNYKSLVFYNSTPEYWNITMSLADSNGSDEVYDLCRLDKNCVSYWDLGYNENNRTDAYKDEKGNNHGTPTGTNNATGISSGAMRFDGLDDRINITSMASSISPISVSVWFNTKSAGVSQTIVTKELEFILRYENTNRLKAFLNDGSWSNNIGITALTSNTWYHGVFTFDGTNLNLYLNGILENTTTDALTASANNIEIGARTPNTGSLQFFNGSIDEVLIYNDSLTASEVEALYKAGLSQHANTNITLETRTASSYNVSDVNLISLWSFNDDNSSHALDETGSHNGTRQGSIADATDANGTVGKGYWFDSTGDYIDVEHHADFAFSGKNFTFTMWIKPEYSSETYDMLLSKGSGDIQWYLQNGGAFPTNLQFTENQIAGIVTCKNNITEDTWQHIAVVRIGTDYRQYIDGVLCANKSYAGEFSGTENLRIGAEFVANRDYKGAMDEVRIYDRSLSASEIKNLYEIGSYHINWNNWDNEGKVDDLTVIQSTSSGNFLQVRPSFYTNDTKSSPYLLNYSMTGGITDTPPTVSNIIWSTIGGFTDSTLIYNQILTYINATCTDDKSSLTCNITVYDPDNNTVVNDQQMTGVGSSYTYTNNIDLNKVGIWNISVTATDSLGQTATDSATFTVSIVSQSLIDGFYGYSIEEIPSNATITSLANYEYNLIEFYDNAANIDAEWASTKSAIKKANELNIKVGLKYYLDYNLSIDEQSRKNFMDNITANFPDLLGDPEIDTVEYIKFDVNKSVGYTEANLTTNNLNLIGDNTTDITDNFFVVYSNYNSSNLDTDYVQYGEDLIYINAFDMSNLIDKLANYTRNSTFKTRIYYGLNSTMQNITHIYQTNIMIPLTSSINTTTALNQSLVSELANGDLIVYNNQSSVQNFTYNVSNGTDIIGMDLWDSVKGVLIENNSDGIVTFLNIKKYSAILVFTENIDHIEMDSMLTEGTAFKQNADKVRNTNYTLNNGTDAYQANVGRAVELWDNNYVSPTTMIFYGQLNQTAIVSPGRFSDLTYLIIDDKHAESVDELFWSNLSIGGVYGYISVADYNDTVEDAWYTNKTGEVDAWLARNQSFNIFFDGLDAASITNADAFITMMKNLTDYAKITKDREVGINVFTNYSSFAQLSSTNGFAMKESCTHRWQYVNGVDDSAGYNYSNQYWSDFQGYGDYNKSLWYNKHNINLVCVVFIDRNNTAYQPSSANYSLMEKLYFKARVLGYENIAFSTPHFNIAYFDKFYDVGTSLQSEPTVDNDLYYMRYTNGIVYYNETSDQAWFDDGTTFNNASIEFNLYDDVSHTYNICINEYCGYTITTPGNGFSNPVDYPWFPIYINETVFNEAKGHFNVTISSGNGGYISADSNSTTFNLHSFNNLTGDFWSADGKGVGNYLIRAIINTTVKDSFDTTNQITQTNTENKGYTTTNITSKYDFNTNIWTYQNNFTAEKFHNITAYDTTQYILINYTNTTTCTTQNPIFNYSNIDNIGTVGMCIEQAGKYILSRAVWPYLSLKSYQIDHDNTPPYIDDFVTSINLEYLSDQMINYEVINASDPSGLNTTPYHVNDTALFNISDTGAMWNISGLNIGTYKVNVSAVDWYLNTNFSTLELIITVADTTPPNITLIEPVNDSVSGSYTLDFKYTASDVSNITNCTLFVNGTKISSNNLTLNFTYTLTLQGPYTWYVTCGDERGNNATSVTNKFNVTIGAVTTTAGGGSRGTHLPVTANGTVDLQKLYACKQKDTFLERIKDKCKNDDDFCDDGETPLNSEDCDLTIESITCQGFRCVFTEMWFLKILLVLGIFFIASYKKDYKVLLIIISIIILMNIIDVNTLLPVSEQTTTNIVSGDNKLLNFGKKIMPSNPEIGLLIAIGGLFYIFRWATKPAPGRKK